MRLNDTKKSFPIVIDQITEAHNLLDALLKQFSSERGTDKKKDIESFDQMIDYQNRINSRLGKLWIIYKKEVEQYHIDKERLPGSDGPDSNDAGGNDSDSGSVSGPSGDSKNSQVEYGYMYLANSDFVPTPDYPEYIQLFKDSFYVAVNEPNDAGEFTTHPYGQPTNQGVAHESYFDLTTKRKPEDGAGIIKKIRPDYSYVAVEDVVDDSGRYLNLTKDKRYNVMSDVNEDNGDFVVRDPEAGVEGLSNVKYFNVNSEEGINVVRYVGKYYIALEDFPGQEEGDLDVYGGKQYYLLDMDENGWGLVTDEESGKMANIPLSFLNEVGVDPVEEKKNFIPGFTYVYLNENEEGKYIEYIGDNKFAYHDDHDNTFEIDNIEDVVEVEAGDNAIVVIANNPANFDEFDPAINLETEVGDVLEILDYSYDPDGDFKDSYFFYVENEKGETGYVPIPQLVYSDNVGV
jgi:hypothetical protein